MTRSTTKKLTKPLDEPKREFCRLRRAAWRQQKNESLTIAGKNLFDDEASSSNNARAEPLIPTKLYGNTLFLIFHDNISQKDRGKLDQFAHFRFSSLTEEEGWNQIDEYVQYQDDLWDDSPPPVNISSISEIIKSTFKGRLKRAYKQISYLTKPTQRKNLINSYLIYDIYGGAHEADECHQNNPPEQVCLSGGDIYDDPSLLRFYQNDDVSPWGISQQKEVGESGPDWVVRSKFEDKLIGESRTTKPDALIFAITTRSGTSTRDPPYPTPPKPTATNHTEGTIGKEGPMGEEPSIVQDGESP
ncbi:hypothetical protein Tco_1564329 [Tanacetum coccineum]